MTKQVVHPIVADPASGSDVALRQLQAKRFHDQGYSVCPVPVDGHLHPLSRNKPQVCQVCTEREASIDADTERAMVLIEGGMSVAGAILTVLEENETPV